MQQPTKLMLTSVVGGSSFAYVSHQVIRALIFYGTNSNTAEGEVGFFAILILHTAMLPALLFLIALTVRYSASLWRTEDSDLVAIVTASSFLTTLGLMAFPIYNLLWHIIAAIPLSFVSFSGISYVLYQRRGEVR